MDKKRHSILTHPALLLGCFVVLVVSMTIPTAIYAEKSPQAYIITSPGSGYRMRVADTLIETLTTNGVVTASVPASKLENLAPADDAVFITFGDSTSSKVIQLHGDSPQLNITYDGEHIEHLGGHSHSVLALTQPACRQILFVRKLEPGWESAAIITSKQSSSLLQAIRQCAAQHNLTLRIYPVDNEKELLQKLVEAVEQNDVLLALADTVVYNSRSIKNILLTAYRHRKPVIGYSNSFVEAGAVAAIYTSAEDAGKQAAEIVQNYISAKGCFNRETYTPSAFTVSINRQVARALDIELDQSMDLSDDLDLLEIR